MNATSTTPNTPVVSALPNPATTPAPDSHITSQRVAWAIRNRINPIRGLTPERLANALDMYRAGYLRDAVLLWDAIEQRDPVVKNVANKRKKAVASLAWEIVPEDDSAEAAAHQATLKAAYDALQVCHVLDQDQAGGVDLLIKQMADAIGKKYAVHEILIRPGLRGGVLSAQLNFCPPWFFEARSGRLRYLPWDFVLDGLDMPADEWLVTVADDVLMEATSVAYLYKNSALRDWVNYVERFGLPYLLGKTEANKGEPEWEAMLDAVGNFGSDGGAVIKNGSSLEPVTVAASGDQPHPALIAYMDEKIIQLWRGGDLSTASKGGQATGASLQGEETDILLVDDAKFIAGTLRQRLDAVLIAYKFGAGTKPKAHFTLVIPDQQDTTGDIAVDKFLLGCGVKLAVSDALRRYGRAEVEAGERALTAPAIPAGPVDPQGKPLPDAEAPDVETTNELAGQIDAGRTMPELAAALADFFAPLRERIAAIVALPDGAVQAGLERLQGELARHLLDSGTDERAVKVITDALAHQVAAGLGGSPNAS